MSREISLGCWVFFFKFPSRHVENDVCFLKCELELEKLEFKRYLMAEEADGNM